MVDNAKQRAKKRNLFQPVAIATTVPNVPDMLVGEASNKFGKQK